MNKITIWDERQTRIADEYPNFPVFTDFDWKK